MTDKITPEEKAKLRGWGAACNRQGAAFNVPILR